MTDKNLTVGDLRKILDRANDADTVVVCLSDPSVGPVAMVSVRSANSGFAWESGYFLLAPAYPLVRQTNDQALWDAARDLIYCLSGDHITRRGKKYQTGIGQRCARLLERFGHRTMKIDA